MYDWKLCPFPGGREETSRSDSKKKKKKKKSTTTPRRDKKTPPRSRRKKKKKRKDGFRGVREPRRRPDVLQRVAVLANRSDANRVTDRRGRDAGEIDSGNAGVTVRTGGVRRMSRSAEPSLHGGLRAEIVEMLPVRVHEQLTAKLSRSQPTKLTRGIVSDVYDGGVYDDE